MFRFRISSRFTVAYMAIVVLLIAGPTVVWAQLEEIIVTTRKREESLQRVPIAVKVIGAEQIELQGINSLEKAVMLDPSVNFQTGYNAADTKVMIRGISPTRGRANVAFLVDGIDITSENMIAAGAGLLANRRLLNDVERIEIVKGSQSALFGRAAFAGAIAYTTKEPGEVFASNLRVDAADNGYLDISGAIGGPVPGLEDVLGLRFNGVYWSDDGFYENSISGDSVGGGEGFGGALVGVWTPGDAWKIKARVEYSDDQYDPSPNVRLVQDTPVVYPEATLIPDIIGGFSNSTAAMQDHGLFCSEILPDNLVTFDERQLALKEIFPDYPTMPADPGAPLAEAWRRPLSDGSDPLRPGFCLPSSYGSASGTVVQQSEDPATGEDYDGTNLQTTRATLLIEYDLDWGTFSSNSGFTKADGTVRGDQDHRARSRPDTFLQAQGSNTDKDTEQFSQELRFSSSWDNSPVQLTLGGLYWHEERQTIDRNFIIDCFLTGKTALGLALDIPGLCDGATRDGTVGGPGTTLDNWQAYWQQLQPYEGGLWEAETEHWSIYGMLEIELAEKWTLVLEDRWVISEEFELNRPNNSNCTNFAFGIFGGETGILPGAFLDEAENPGFNALCTVDGFVGDPILFEDLPADIQAHYLQSPFNPDILCQNFANILLPGFPLKANGIDPLEPYVGPIPDANNTPLSVDTLGCPYGNISGTQKSDWHAPKITLNWFATDTVMIYGSWARSVKPEGINQNSAGGTATSIPDERFDSEIMEYWELGAKTSWNAAGHLTLNGSLFFQDYTDKQVGTQILVPDGQGGFRSNPRVINASSAEIWGLEIEATWLPDFMEGLVLSASYTHLEAEYVDFIDETTNFVRAAMAGGCPLVWKNSDNETVATGPDNPNPPPTAEMPFPQFAIKCALDLSGNKLEFSPEDAFVAQGILTRALFDTGIDWTVGLDAVYQSERFVDQDNFVILDEFWLFDMRAGLLGDTWDILLYINNLFDDDTYRAGSTGPDFGPAISDMGFSAGLVRTHFFGPLPPPRVLGVRFNMRFGG